LIAVKPLPNRSPLKNVDQQGVIFCTGMSGGQKLLEEDSHLLPVGRALRD